MIGLWKDLGNSMLQYEWESDDRDWNECGGKRGALLQPVTGYSVTQSNPKTKLTSSKDDSPVFTKISWDRCRKSCFLMGYSVALRYFHTTSEWNGDFPVGSDLAVACGKEISSFLFHHTEKQKALEGFWKMVCWWLFQISWASCAQVEEQLSVKIFLASLSTCQCPCTRPWTLHCC